MKLLALITAVTIASVGCGRTVTSPTPLRAALGESLSLKFQTAHFQVFGSTTPDATLRAAAARLEAVVRLLESSADLQAALGVSNAEFEAAWQSYVRQRYLS